MRSDFACRQHHPAATGALVVLFWMIAALLVIAAHAADASVATIGAIAATSYAYTQLTARNAGVTHALGVGIAWLTLSIATEVAFGARLGHGWFTLLGSPDRPLLRSVVLFAWIFAPAVLARRREF